MLVRRSGSRWRRGRVYRQQDRGLVVGPAFPQNILRCGDGLADIADAHGRTIAISNDQIVIHIGVAKFIIGVERECLTWAVERAFG